MGLQVRVRHALGDRLIELPDRDIDNPVTVGRASGVEVQVPSVGVAPRHCVLFRFDGHWAVQDVGAASGGNTSGTYVNGHQVVDPVMLQVGDVISIGSEASAPTIEVDPAAAAEGHTGWAGSNGAAPAAPAAPAYADPGYPAPGDAPAHYPVPGVPGAPGGAGYSAGYGGGYAAPAVPMVPSAAPAPAAWSAAAHAPAGYGSAAHGEAGNAAETGDHVDMSGLGAEGAAPAASYRRSSRRAKPQTSQAALMIGIIAAFVIIGGTAWIVYEKTSESDVVIKPPPPKPVEEDSHHPKSIFDFGQGGGPSSGSRGSTGGTPAAVRPAAPDPTSATPAAPADPSPAATPPATPSTPADEGSKPAPAKPEEVASAETPGAAHTSGTTPKPKPATPDSPDMSEPPSTPLPTGTADDWEAMTNLHDSPANAALAIFRFNDFQKQHPGQHADEIKSFMDDKFDRLWWDRIEQLFKKRDRIAADIKKLENLIWDETNPVEKKKEKDDKDDLEKKLKATKEIMTVKMGYTDDQPPPADKAGLAALREKRDANKYTEWKRTTLNSIINEKGKTGWEADN